MSELPVQTANQCCSRQPSVLESPSFQRKQTNKKKQGHVQTESAVMMMMVADEGCSMDGFGLHMLS